MNSRRRRRGSTGEAAGGFRLALIGEAALLRRYQVALKSFGLQSTSLQNTAAAGMYHLLTLAGGSMRPGSGADAVAGAAGKPLS